MWDYEGMLSKGAMVKAAFGVAAFGVIELANCIIEDVNCTFSTQAAQSFVRGFGVLYNWTAQLYISVRGNAVTNC